MTSLDHGAMYAGAGLLDDTDALAPRTPSRDQVRANRLTVVRSLQSIVSFAAPDKRDGNGRFMADLLATASPIEDDEWGKLALIVGVYARTFPVPDMNRVQVRRLWDATRWAVWYEHWYREGNRAGRINQLVSLLQRLPLPVAREIVAQTTAELRAVLTVAKSKALNGFVGYLESVDLGIPQAHVLLAEARERCVTESDLPRPVFPTPVYSATMSPALVPAQMHELLALRLTTDEVVSEIENVWGYLDPQLTEVNQNQLERGRQGDFRPLADLATYACKSAEWRLRNRRSTVSEEDIRTLCALGLFASGYTGDRMPGVLRAIGLYGLYLLGFGALGVEGYARLVEMACQEFPEARERIIEQAINAGVRQLDDRPTGVDSELLPAWVLTATAWISVADQTTLSRFVAALDRHGVEESVDLLLLRKAAATAESGADDGLSFLSASDRAVFDEYCRKGFAYEIADLLAKHERAILEALSRALAAPAFGEYRPPAKSLKLSQVGNYRFAELKRKALSGDVADARDARDGFAGASTVRPDQRQILREWRVYAAMRVNVFDAIPEWLEAFNAKSASLEERWNLSVFNAGQREYAKALEFLQSSVTTARSPYEYMVFACYLAIQALLHDVPSADADRARDFLIGNLRDVLAPEAQLSWIALANRHRDDKDVMQFSDAISAYRALLDSPIVLPPPSLPGYPSDFAQRAQKLEPLIDDLKRLKMVRTLRLWFNGVLAIPSSENWLQVWDWAATACANDGDVNAAINVLRRIAKIKLSEYRYRCRRNEDTAEKAANFLRRILIHLCELARAHDRENLLYEIAEKYVKPVRELQEPTGQNRVLHGYLRVLLTTTPAPEGPDELHVGDPVPRESAGADEVWGQLSYTLAEVAGIGDLSGPLRTRIENALDIYPGRHPRGRAVAEALRGQVATIGNLSSIGADAEEMPALLDTFATNLDAVANDIERWSLLSLRVLVSMLRRVTRAFAEEGCAPPVPQVAVHANWLGLPSDLESSSVVVDVSFPGPGIARNVTVWAGRNGDSEPRFDTVTLAALVPGDPQCLALPVHSVAEGAATSTEVTVTVQYDWNFMNRVRRAVTINVPIADFAGFLAARQIYTQEFPDPFVVDGPLSRDDVRTSLFQGRAREIEEVRRVFSGAQFPTTPMCFYGIRRTGKTSLLRRVATELDQMGLIPIEVSLHGISASKLRQEQVFSAFFAYLWQAVRTQCPDIEFAPDVPVDHPNPLMLVNGFFETLSAAFASRGRVVLLLDEFQMLIAEAGEPLLDSLRPICERGLIALIAFANQGQDVMINMPGQLAVQSRRVDFLSEDETANAISVPLEQLGVVAPPGTLRCVYEYTAGHPNFTMKLVKSCLATLNLEHRNVLGRNDVEAAARELLRFDGLFTTSWFSNKNLSPTEEDTAIKFAKMGEIGAGLTVDDERLSQFDDAVLRNLDRKLVLQATGGRIRVRGRLLEEYLRKFIGGTIPPPRSAGLADRVGLFIDLENVISCVPSGVSYRDAGLAMQRFAAGFGEVKVRFAVAVPRNIPDWHEVKLGLESSGICVSEVSPRLRNASKANLADMYLNDNINEEVDDKELTTIVIATGDKDFLGMIEKYLDRDIRVQLLGGSVGSTARLYHDLAMERRQRAYALGRTESDFDVTVLEELLATGEPSA